MRKIDLNCDLGESFGAYTLGMDGEVMPYITSANIACGFHAGDANVMAKTVKMAVDKGVAIGAHPGFPDLLGFGRRNMDCTPEEIQNYVIYQVGALKAFCAANGIGLQHVKPHGALYNMAVSDERLAKIIAQAVARVDSSLILVALGGRSAQRMKKIGEEAGIRIAFEAFPDRAYNPDGSLVSRKQAGSVIHDPEAVADRALRMALQGEVIAIDGSRCTMEVHTLCVHGDNPTAVELVSRIRQRLTQASIAVSTLRELVAS